MEKSTNPKMTAANEAQAHRHDFLKKVAANPNYFGNLKQGQYKPVVSITKDTSYEQITCLGFNPPANLLEAVVQVKRASGYNGPLCHGGSFEYVRFFVDYGSGWEDAGLAAISVHDIPDGSDCRKNKDKPLSYAASVQLSPKSNWCFFPVLPRVRAILSWNAIPTAGDATYVPVWGNVLDAQIQIRPRPILKWVLPQKETEELHFS